MRFHPDGFHAPESNLAITGTHAVELIDRVGVVVGTEDDDRLTPTEPIGKPHPSDRPDLVHARAGDDWVDAAGGADRVWAGEGDDTVVAGEGKDWVDGGIGDDSMLGGNGADMLLGGAGNDTLEDIDNDIGLGAGSLYGGEGNDTIRADHGDLVSGGGGDDQISFSFDLARIDAGSGDDEVLLNYIGTGSVVRGGEGNDWIHGTGSYEASRIIDGGAGDDRIDYGEIVDPLGRQSTIKGGTGDDVITLRAGAFRIDAGAGDDRIDYQLGYAEGTNTLITGAGSDTVGLAATEFFEQAIEVTDFQAGPGGDRLDLAGLLPNLYYYDATNPFLGGLMRMVSDGGDTVLQIDIDGPAEPGIWFDMVRLRGVDTAAMTPENFVGDVSPFTDIAPRDLIGTADTDTLAGADGDDRLDGLAGDDLLDGGFDGDDSLSGGAGSDRLFGFSGDDLLLMGDGADKGSGGAGDDTLLGGEGDDSLSYSETVRGLSSSGAGLDGGTGDDLVDGGAGNDRLIGGDGHDTLIGGDGNDTLFGGDDKMYGGAGDDNLLGGINDTMYGGEGNDSLTGSHGAVMDAGMGSDSIFASGVDLNVLGGDGDDSIEGVSLFDSRIDGGAGNDTIVLLPYMNASDVTISGGAGDDSIALHGQDMRVFAGAGDDRISLATAFPYGERTSVVTTGAGADVVAPGLGDSFQPYLRDEMVVTDFDTRPGHDRIDLADLNLTLGLDAQADPFASGQARLTASGGDTLLEVDIGGAGGGGALYYTVMVLQGVAPSSLTPEHFLQAVTPVSGANAEAPRLSDDKTVWLDEGGSAALGLAAPVDPDGGEVAIAVLGVPTWGSVTLSDGSAVQAGQVLSATQVEGLRFDTQGSDGYGSFGRLRYSVTDDEGSVVSRDVVIEVNPAPDAQSAGSGNETPWRAPADTLALAFGLPPEGSEWQAASHTQGLQADLLL